MLILANAILDIDLYAKFFDTWLQRYRYHSAIPQQYWRFDAEGRAKFRSHEAISLGANAGFRIDEIHETGRHYPVVTLTGAG